MALPSRMTLTLPTRETWAFGPDGTELEHWQAPVYQCSRCGLHFAQQPGAFLVACCVLYAPGTCCHYMEDCVERYQNAYQGTAI